MNNRRFKMLPLDAQFFFQLDLDPAALLGPATHGIQVQSLLRVFNSMMDDGLIPPDAVIEWLYYDLRLSAWALLIWSEGYDLLRPNEPAPILEIRWD